MAVAAKSEPLFSGIRGFLLALTLVGLVVAVIRLIAGLGATTNLSNGYPWGIWVFFDLFLIPFSAGAFTIATVVHIFNQKQYKPLLRPVVLAGLLGYSLTLWLLLLDLGRPDRFYNVFIYLNPRSFMFEVAWCLSLYTGVLVLEFLPAYAEKYNLKGLQGGLSMLGIVILSAGILLSVMHQSSLGGLFLLLPGRIHPLWSSDLLALFFLVSSVAGGLSMIILISAWAFRAFKHPLDYHLFSGIARASVWVLGLYFIMTIVDLMGRHTFGRVFEGNTQSVLFLIEMIIGILLPLIMFASQRVRESKSGLIWAAIFVSFGLALNRTNIAFYGFDPIRVATYFPYWMEWITTLGGVAGAILIFYLIARYFPIFVVPEAEELAEARGGFFTAIAITLLAIGIILEGTNPPWIGYGVWIFVAGLSFLISSLEPVAGKR
ncbi:MAG: NrfD/PsrC family molybdoenzyme membrane anchor subunit [Nitrospirota bacterium]